MAIVQISKIQQRAGNLVDLPQLDNAEFGWATDENRLFIGRTGNTYADENIEVLTSYSNISFSQINGSDGGNFNIVGPQNGQILTYVSSTDTWENYTGLNAQLDGDKLNLGDVSNISMTGGAIGYILETDGLGNLSWTPKNTLYSNITNFYPTVFTGSIGTSTLSGVVIVGTGGQFTCTASSTTLYVGMAVTISGTNGGGGSITSYTDPTTYLISVTNGSTSFTLTTSLGAAIVTTSGTPTGLTYTLSNLLNISAATLGSVGVGTYITGTSVTAGTYITAYGTGTGGTGTYIVNTSQTIASTTLYGPLIMRVANTTPYTNGQAVTISGANGVANSSINGLTFYMTLTANYASSGNVSLYTDSGRTAIANVSTLTYTNSPNAIATAALGGSGGSGVGGSNTTVQFNDQNISNGVAGFTFNKSTTTLTVTSGNVIAANINATTAVTSPILVSNIALGTAPLTVTSTTLVPNLFVARSNVSEYSNTALTTTGTWYPLFVNATSGNLAQGANANLSFNAATGNLTTTLLNVTGNANTGNLGTTTLVATTGNITTINSGLMQNGTSNITIASAGNVSTFIGGNATAQFVVTSTGANITGNASVGNLSTGTAIITTGNITTINSGLMQNGSANITIASNGNVSIYANANTTAALVIANSGINVSGYANIVGNANIGNLGTAQVFASANITTPQFISNVASGTAPLVVTSPTRVANLNVDQSNIANYANVVTQTTGTFYPTMVNTNTTANYQLGSNANLSFAVSTGTLSATLFSGNGSSLTAIAGANVTGIVPNANVATYGAVTTQSSGIYYPIFVDASTTGNYAHASNATISANLANGAIIATTFAGALSGAATTAGTVTTNAQPNITSVSTSFTSLTFANAQTISGNNMILTTGSNTLLGTITGNWSLSAGSKLQATYADLAEYYEADNEYEPGTVLEFGGDKEVTLAQAMTPRVAGVVSTNPAYVMNSTCKGEHIVAIALQGRVPCKVRGTIRKGDLLISDVGGFARPSTIPLMGTVIGKSLENFEGEGVIEVAVGRL